MCPALDGAARHRDRIEADLDVAADQVGGQRVRALVGDRHQLDLGGAREHLRREMIERAGAGRAVLERLAHLLDVGDQLRDVLHRHVLVGEHQAWRHRDQADRREILAHVVAGVLVHARPGREGRRVGEQDGVAVRRRARDLRASRRCRCRRRRGSRPRSAGRAVLVIRSPTMRAMMSLVPPGGSGTTSVIGRVGYCCAEAGAAPALQAPSGRRQRPQQSRVGLPIVRSSGTILLRFVSWP